MTAQARYQVRVEGWVAERWDNWFGEMTVARGHREDGTPVTTVSGTIADQAALRGLLNQLWDLNLTLLSVSRVGDRHASADENG
jgi:hypothetical protein